MTKKKKEVSMPVLGKSKLKKSWFLAVGLALVGLLGLALWARSQPKPEYVEKNVINNYVCKIVGADAEADMIAVECLTK